ncbi:MAG: primosomal protein N' [Phycisphaerales bacterium]
MPPAGLFETDDSSSADAPTSFVRVAVERSLDLSEGLTYAGDDLAIGQRVTVPLGRGDAAAQGFVVAVGGPELLDGFDPRKVKHVRSASSTRLPEPLVELARWMSTYYCCPLGMVLATMVPAAVKASIGRRTITKLEPVPDPPAHGESDLDAHLTPTARAAWDAIRQIPAGDFPIAAKDLAHRVGATNAGPINKLVKLGVLREVTVETVRAPEAFWSESGAALSAPPELTSDQHAAVEGITKTLGSFAPHLLRGVTGSGKTEVYLRLIERVVASGQSAIVLVPEIALTPQTAERFLARFEHLGVAVLHSGLTGATRNKQWAAAASGAAKVVVGARSAVFAPVPNLGLIVVDEEHDQSYKQDQLPRYHARDVAVVRASIEHVPVVLGSATPSMESWHNAQTNRYTLWHLPARVAGLRMPAVEIVDMRAERKKRREQHGDPRTLESIGPTLASAIEQTLTAGGQAILLLNRRGFASYVACPDSNCGWVLGCDACDTRMVVHRAQARRAYVRCHHCLAEQLLPKTCPSCGKKVIELGSGTQRAEQEIERRFGTTLGLIEGETFARVDSDTMRRASDYFDLLARFGRGELKLLLGTQMLAKGLDYPNVRLVGVLNADTSIGVPDFRACERTFQLVTQVAGRAGRGRDPGRVIVQTMSPDEPAIRLAAQHDFETFAKRELATRHASQLPPRWRMARVIVRDRDHDAAEEHARDIARAVRAAADESVVVQGPAPCPIARVAEHFRFAIELFAPNPKSIQRALAAPRGAGLLKADARTAIDVDPVAVL